MYISQKTNRNIYAINANPQINTYVYLRETKIFLIYHKHILVASKLHTERLPLQNLKTPG